MGNSNNAIDLQISQIKTLPFDRLEVNEGQLEGLPANPREIGTPKFEKLKNSISEHPEFLRYNMLKVYPLANGNYIIIGGNMRFRAMQDLGYTKVPCMIIEEGTSIEDLKAYVILDNASFGKWEWSMLANEWEAAQLQEWGVDLPIFSDDGKSWDDLDYINEQQEDPVLEKKCVVRVHVPDEFKESKNDIIQIVKDALVDYEGIKVD